MLHTWRGDGGLGGSSARPQAGPQPALTPQPRRPTRCRRAAAPAEPLAPGCEDIATPWAPLHGRLDQIRDVVAEIQTVPYLASRWEDLGVHYNFRADAQEAVLLLVPVHLEMDAVLRALLMLACVCKERMDSPRAVAQGLVRLKMENPSWDLLGNLSLQPVED